MADAPEFKQYRKVKEDKDHYVVKHPSGESFFVAKKGLKPELLERINSLYMADGGVVPLPKNVPDEETDSGLNYTPAFSESQPASTEPEMVVNPIFSKIGNHLKDSMVTGIKDAAQVYTKTLPSWLGLTTKNPDYKMFDAHRVPYAAPEAESSAPRDVAGPTMGPPAPSPYDQLNVGFNNYQDAMAKAAQAEGAAGNSAAKQFDYIAEETKKADLQRQDMFNKMNAEFDAHYNDIKNEKINPNRYWDNMSTGNKVMAGIGLVLSGIGSGLTGKDNMAMDFINKAIANDIGAQKENMNKNERMFELNMKRYQNQDAALSATLAAKTAIARAYVDKAAALARGPEAQARLAQLSLGLKEQQLNYAKQAAVYNMVRGGGGSISPIEMEQINPEMAKKMVKLPNGTYGFAKDQESAHKADETMSAINEFKDQLNSYKRFMTSVGRTMPLSDQDAYADQLRQNLILSMNKIHGLSRMSDTDLHVFNTMVKSPGAWRQGQALSKINALEDFIDGRTHSMLSQYVSGYQRPQKINFKPGN